LNPLTRDFKLELVVEPIVVSVEKPKVNLVSADVEPIAEEIVPKINVSDFLKSRAAKKNHNESEL
jgi:hypothetical protein